MRARRAPVLFERQVVRIDGRTACAAVVVSLHARARRQRRRAAEEQHGLRDDLGRVALLAVLALPRTGVQTAFDVRLPALLQELAAQLRELVPRDDVEPVGLLAPLALRRL